MLWPNLMSVSVMPALGSPVSGTSTGGTPLWATVLGWVVTAVVAVTLFYLGRHARGRDKEDDTLGRLEEAALELNRRTRDVYRERFDYFSGEMDPDNDRHQATLDAQRIAHERLSILIDRVKRHDGVRTRANTLNQTSNRIRFTESKSDMKDGWSDFSRQYEDLRDCIREARRIPPVKREEPTDH